MTDAITKEQLLDQYESLRVQENVLITELNQRQAQVVEQQAILETHQALVAAARQLLLDSVESSIAAATPKEDE